MRRHRKANKNSPGLNYRRQNRENGEKKDYEWLYKNFFLIKQLLLNRFHTTQKILSRGRGKRLRGEGRVSLFPARPISLSGRLFDGKKMPAAFSPSYAI